MSLKYREELEYALNNVSFMVSGGMKIGIVGRTGAGKTSIVQTLFRLNEISGGSILIDGVKIKDLNL